MTDASARRSRMLGGIALMLLGLLATLYTGYGARERALVRATGQVQTALVPVIERNVGIASLQQRVVKWVDVSRAGVSYLTVRGSDGRTLASAGAWRAQIGWLDRLVSKSTAREWQALTYHIFCAERRATLTGAGGNVLGTLRLGVAWWWITLGAGVEFWLAIVLVLFGLALVLRASRVTASGAADAPVAGVSDVVSVDGSDPQSGPKLADQTTRLDTRSSKSRASAGSVTQYPKIDPVSAGETSGQSTPKTGKLPATDAQGAEPALRFLPVWREAFDGVLAGGIVILARPEAGSGQSGGSPWVSIEELVASSSGEAEKRVLTARLVQRLATLVANWQTLELPRVPLLLAVPSALLDFEGAAETWAQALDGFDRVAEDLVLCVDRVPEAIRQVLSVRWALPDVADANGVPRYRLIADNERLAGHAESAPAMDAIPVASPTHLAANEALAPMTAREFARLLRHRELAPL